MIKQKNQENYPLEWNVKFVGGEHSFENPKVPCIIIDEMQIQL